MLAINLSQQGRVHMGRRELLQELLGPIVEAHARLLPQGPGIHQPADLVLAEESEAPPLASLLLHLLGEL